MNRKLRFAIVGCNGASRSHVEAIEARPDTALVSIVEPDDDKRVAASRAWGCSAFPDIETMLSQTPVDAACVCSPPADRQRATQQLIEAGAHVLCEKPLAAAASDARFMVQHARAHGRTLRVASKFRYVRDIQEARRLIERGAIGRPVYYEVTFCAHVPRSKTNGRKPEDSGPAAAGVVMDNGAHVYDLLSCVLDSPIESLAAVFARSARGIEHTAEIQFHTRNGQAGRVALSWTYFTKDLDYLMVQGSRGGIRVGWTGGSVRRHGEREWQPFGTGFHRSSVFDLQLSSFVSDILASAGSGENGSGNGNGRRWRPADDPHAVRAIEFVDSIYEAERSGRRMYLPDGEPVTAA